MSTKLSHAHRLKRHTYKTGNSTYICTLPDCYFRIAPELSLGKRALCWRCGKEFILSSYAITLAKPHCEECHVHKDGVSKPTAKAVLTPVAVASNKSLLERLQTPAVTYKTIETDEDIL